MGKQSKVSKIYVHHSASPKASTDTARIRRWHLDRGWNDIGYHWVIEHDGQPNPIQWTLLCCMLQYLMYKYKLTKEDISYHKAVAATACPGKNLITKLKEWLVE